MICTEGSIWFLTVLTNNNDAGKFKRELRSIVFKMLVFSLAKSVATRTSKEVDSYILSLVKKGTKSSSISLLTFFQKSPKNICLLEKTKVDSLS